MNKIKIGDKVKLTPNTIEWMASPEHIETYRIPGCELDKEDLPEIYVYLHHFFNKKPLIGKVIGYGSTDEEFENKREYVYVNFRININRKICSFNTYFSEKHIRKVK
jgi:hypothetical protein